MVNLIRELPSISKTRSHYVSHPDLVLELLAEAVVHGPLRIELLRDARFLVLADLEDVQRWGDQCLGLELFLKFLLREGYANELETSWQQLVREDADHALLQELGVRLRVDPHTRPGFVNAFHP